MDKRDRDMGKSNSGPGESREWVTEDKIGGWDGVLYSSMIVGTGGCIPGLGGLSEPGARKPIGLREPAGNSFNIP